jgi:hypothetical protein
MLNAECRMLKNNSAFYVHYSALVILFLSIQYAQITKSHKDKPAYPIASTDGGGVLKTFMK